MMCLSFDSFFGRYTNVWKTADRTKKLMSSNQSDQQPKIKAYSIYTDIKQTVLPFKEAETTEYLAILLDKL